VIERRDHIIEVIGFPKSLLLSWVVVQSEHLLHWYGCVIVDVVLSRLETQRQIVELVEHDLRYFLDTKRILRTSAFERGRCFSFCSLR
jgi:hypothetical protein